jgi:Icc-related predicted phosphoesterase
MIILHVTDLHLNERWFRWLAESAPSRDLLCISGDLLDRNSPVHHRDQVGLVAEWLRAIKGPLCLCSGSHDLEWDAQYECWRPASWLRGPVSSRVWGDGDRFELGGHRFHSISRTSYPKGAAADFWITHAPPSGVAVGRDRFGTDHGEPTLAMAATAHRPIAVFSGRVHEPASWFERRDGVMYLNPGRTHGARFPNFIRFDTAMHDARLVLDSAIGARSEAARWSASFAESGEELVVA